MQSTEEHAGEAPDASPRVQARRLQQASAHAAGHRGALAIARWRSGLSQAELQAEPQAAPAPAAQAAWHAAAQQHFCAWLEQGGFAGQEPGTPAGCAEAPSCLPCN